LTHFIRLGEWSRQPHVLNDHQGSLIPIPNVKPHIPWRFRCLGRQPLNVKLSMGRRFAGESERSWLLLAVRGRSRGFQARVIYS